MASLPQGFPVRYKTLASQSSEGDQPVALTFISSVG